MPARRFFVADRHDVGDRLNIDGSDAHKIVNVLRLRGGDEVEVADSSARIFRAALEIEGGRVYARLIDRLASVDDSRVLIDVAQGVPKGAKMDFVVEKLTELGVSTILPIESERTIVRELSPSKRERWARLARAAAAQSGRPSVPEVGTPLTFDQLLERFGEYDAVLFPWELAEGRPLRDDLPTQVAGARRILVVIGPEGGFSHDEARRAEEAGATIITLGTQIFRTETAALVLLSILRYLVM